MWPRLSPIYKRELRAYFQSPGVYVVLAVFLGLCGLLVYGSVVEFARFSIEQRMRYQSGMPSLNYSEWVVSSAIGLISFLFIFVIPILTMRLFAEEKRLGTFELLATCPISEWGLVLGKYLAALTVILVFLIISSVFPLVLGRLGQTEWHVVAAGYGGLILVALACTAFGVFASTLTESQIIAVVVTFFGLLAFYLIDFMGFGSMNMVSRVLQSLSIRVHAENLIRGRILTDDIAYFLLFSVGFLFLANYVLESRRWRV